MNKFRYAFAGLVTAVLASACDRAADSEQARITPTVPVVFQFQVNGMHCQGCADAITDKVKRVDGVADCRVSLENRQADVTVRNASNGTDVQKAIEKLGYKVTVMK
jgi:copper chaperone CopZ